MAIEHIVGEQPVRAHAAGELVIAEGAASDRIHVVETGDLAVRKGPVGSPGGVKVAVLQAGDCPAGPW